MWKVIGAVSFLAATFILVAPRAAIADDAGQTLCLNTSEPTGDKVVGGPLLVREMVRQGVLIAARDEIGASTRDQALREPFPMDNAGCLKLNVEIRGTKPVTAKITSPDGKTLWEGQISDQDWRDDLITLTDTTAKLSRTGWPEVLKTAGLAANAPPPAVPATRPADLDTNLNTLEIVSQFSALRELHRMLLTSHDPKTQGDLIRAYANLGQLTSFHWTAAPKVFTARSLLYAQRMVDADPKSAIALWHRAYARGMAGLQGAAAEDVKAAQALGGDAPPWAPLLAPYCSYDTGKLVDLSSQTPAIAPLGSFLAYLTLANSFSQGGVMNFARYALTANPECVRLVDDMCYLTGPGPINQLTMTGPRLFSDSLGRHLGQLPDIPPSLAEIVAHRGKPHSHNPARVDLIDCLDDEGAADKDRAEPSWAALGELIRETTFVHITRRVFLIRFQWGVDASDFVAETKLFIEKHPYKNYVLALGLDPATQNQQIDALVHQIHVGDVTLAAEWMLQIMGQHGIKDDAGGKGTALISSRAWSHSDSTTFDISAKFLRSRGQQWDSRDSAIVRLQHASPESPVALGALICYKWDQVKPKAAEWEAAHGTHPEIARALGLKYTELSQWNDAERCIRQWIKSAPDSEAYTSLAAMYEKKGDMPKSIETLKSYINECEDFGLQHAKVQVRLAHYYMDHGDSQQAIAFADAAAETGAGWATDAAREAHERSSTWQSAEAYAAEQSQHYPDAGTQWFLWCRRTGHGDEAKAQAVADAWVTDHLKSDLPDYQSMIAEVYQLENKAADARAAYRRSFDARPDPSIALQIALMCEEANDTAGRDEILRLSEEKAKGAVDTHKRKRVELIRLVNYVAQAFATPQGKLEPAEIEALCDQTPDAECTNIRYYAAWFYRIRGQKEQEKHFLTDIAKQGKEPCYNGVRAWADLRAMGIEPYDLLGQTPQAPLTH